MITYRSTKILEAGQIEALFSSVGWKVAKEPARIVRALKNSHSVFTAWDNDRLVGIVNTLSDGVHTVYIHFVVVHEAYQRRGVGRSLLEMLHRKYSKYRHLVLISNTERIAFFERCGFQKCKGASAMEIRA